MDPPPQQPAYPPPSAWPPPGYPPPYAAYPPPPGYQQPYAAPQSDRDDVAAAFATHRELGPDYDAALADQLLARLAGQIDARIDQRLAAGTNPRFVTRPPRERPSRLVAIVSLPFVLGAPSATSNLGDAGSLVASVLIWLVILAINLLCYFGRRPSKQR